MRQFGAGKTAFDVQLAGFAVRKNQGRRRLWVHTANLRLPLILAKISGKIRPDSLKRLPDIRENSLLH